MSKILSFFNKSKRDNLFEDKKESMDLEGEFVRKRKVENIGIKSSLIEYAAIKRQLKVNRLSSRLLVVESHNGTNYAFHNLNGNSSSRVGKYICDRKHDSRDILKKNGINVVESKKFYITSYDEAVEYVKKIGFPVVVKPTTLSRGRGITTNIQDMESFNQAWEKGISAYKKKRNLSSLLIERHVKGEDYRFFVVGDRVISASHRKRANVVGDGSSTLLELIQQKNNERSKNPYLSDYLIPESLKYLDRLNEHGLNLESIPNAGQEVTLRSQSNLSAGGDSIDVTEQVHPEFNSIAIKSIKSIPGVEYGGVDIITTDITAKPTSSNHIVGEVEYSPAPFAHFPYKGKERDMAGAVLDYYLKKD